MPFCTVMVNENTRTITATVTVVLNENVTEAIAPINWTIEYTATSIEP